jgi:hypothetical protein
MPSPFPGMDPFLEGSLWGSVHHQLIAEIARQLVPLLRPRYIALSQERFVTLMPEAEEGISIVAVQGRGPVYPDVSVTETGITSGSGGSGGGGAVAAGTVAAPIEMETLMPERVPQVSLEIRDQASRELVTAIEVLSPTNKRSNGRDEYLDKRAKYLLSRAHLVEIDLLRSGQRLPMVGQLPSAPYFVFVSPAWKRPVIEVWPISLGERLPRIKIPLAGRDEHVSLDLQRAFSTVYDQCGLELVVDYTRPPEVQLDEQQSEWARSVLAAPRPT